MSESDKTNELAPNIYGEILSQSVYRSSRSDLPSIGSFLSQGAAVGPMLVFLLPVQAMLWHPENGYNFLLIAYLPEFLLGGMLFGLCEGMMIWACSYIVGKKINFVVRAVIGIVILTLLLRAYTFLFVEPAPARAPIAQYLTIIGICVASGVTFGLVIGSRFQPWSELLRGRTDERSPAMNGITGLLLRLFVILSLMVSILFLILSTQGDFRQREFGFAIVATVHFAIAAVIIFARMPFWLLLLLAVVINVPIVMLINEVLTPSDIGMRVITVNYLGLWGAFLLCRRSMQGVFEGRRKAR